MMEYREVLDYGQVREELKKAYTRSVKRRGAFLLLLLPLLVLFFLLAVASGSMARCSALGKQAPLRPNRGGKGLYRQATASISTRAPRGRALTAKAARAG